MILTATAFWLGGAACAAAVRLQVLKYQAPRTPKAWVDLGLRAAFWPGDLAAAIRRTVAHVPAPTAKQRSDPGAVILDPPMLSHAVADFDAAMDETPTHLETVHDHG